MILQITVQERKKIYLNQRKNQVYNNKICSFNDLYRKFMVACCTHFVSHVPPVYCVVCEKCEHYIIFCIKANNIYKVVHVTARLSINLQITSVFIIINTLY